MGTIRLNGLVGAMNRVREQLTAGIPEAKVESFREYVQRTVTEVEKICAANNITPAQLSAPSRNAYLYLKNLDLTRIPVVSSPNENCVTSVRVQNLVRIENEVQAGLARLAQMPIAEYSAEQAVQTRVKLGERIKSSVERVEEITRNTAATPAQLPTQSRQVYEWLAFLSTPENLDAHIRSLRGVMQEANAYSRAANSPRPHFEFSNMNGLFRIKRAPNQSQMTSSEGFINAPREILKALVQLAYQRDESASLGRLRGYAQGDEFGEVLLTLSLPTMDLETNTRGRHYDLREIFTRVNQQYFGGKINSPRLVWNRTLTFRKMGHYVSSTDTLMMSLTLDDARVPMQVVDLVMYHELLHKALGVQIINGRRFAHSSTFRQAERRFVEYSKAEAWLSQWGKQFSGIEA